MKKPTKKDFPFSPTKGWDDLNNAKMQYHNYVTREKPLKGKKIEFTIISNEEISFFTEQGKKRIPLTFKTKADAYIQIADHIKDIALSVKAKRMPEDRLENGGDYEIAYIEYKKDGLIDIFHFDGYERIRILFTGKLEEAHTL